MEQQEFINRLIQLRMGKNVSAREMSLSIGQHDHYITDIENGVHYPSMQVFFYICEYFDISPMQFFNVEIENPSRVNYLTDLSQALSSEKLESVISIVEKLSDK